MTADTVGGVFTYAVDLCAALGRHGVEVVLAFMGAPLSHAQRRAAGALANTEVHESQYKLEWMQDAWDDVTRAGDWLLELGAREQVDLAHLNGYSHAALDFGVPAVVVAHSCVMSWWRAVKGCAAPSSWNEYARRIRQGLSGADVIVAPTRAMLDALGPLYGVSRPSRVIHNGRPPRAGGRMEKRPYVLGVGRSWDEAKNMRALDDAAATLAWPVYVAGDTRSPDGQCRVFRNLRSLGALAPEQLLPWFDRASICAHPARYEPFGLSVLEAAQAGCALVLGDIASLRELWQGAACFVNPDDSTELAWQLGRLSVNQAERHANAERCHARAQSFGLERTAAEYLALYRSLRRRPQSLGVTSCAS